MRRDARPSRRDGSARRSSHDTPVASTVVLAATGFCGRELYAIADRPNQLYMVGSMGCVAPLALGLALARPDLTVVALDGDGAALMRLGAFATVGAYGPPNLRHLLLDNGVHDSTGGQATVSPSVSFAEVAAACGYATVARDRRRRRASPAGCTSRPPSGPRFARLLIRAGTPHDLPRPSVSPVEVKQRLLQHLGARLMLLLNPGPVTLSERVRRSLLQPDLCHRESEFFDLQDEARAAAARGVRARSGGVVRGADHGLRHRRGREHGRDARAAGWTGARRRERRLRRADRADLRAIPHRARALQGRLDAGARSRGHRPALEARLASRGARALHARRRGASRDDDRPAQRSARAAGSCASSMACSCWWMQSAASAPSPSTSRDDALAAAAATANKCLHGVPGVAFVIVRRARARARREPRVLSRPGAVREPRRIGAIRPSRPPCMRTMRWSRRCASTRSRAAGRRVTGAMRHSRSRCEPASPRSVSPPCCRPRESSVVLRSYGLPAASLTPRCTMR